MNNTMKNFIYGVLLILSISGCATYVMKTPFNKQDFAEFTKTGTAYINGQAFLTTRGGEVRYGAGKTVRLIPVTKYTMELHVFYGDRQMRPPSDVNLAQFVRTAVGNGSGNFAFEEVPAGDYFLECAIYWDVGNERTGSTIRKRVHVDEGIRGSYILTE